MTVNMTITTSMLIAWVIMGALAGTLVGRLAKFSKKGYGAMTNFGIGLVGAALGGIAFRLFGIDLGLKKVSVSLEDMVAALLGSLVFILGLALLRRIKGGKQ